jgi:hypothetical protein
MTTEQLQSAIHATPFRPFTLRVADGQQIRVPHPDFIAHRPGGRTAAVFLPDDSTKIVDLLMVTTLDYEQPAAR